MYFLLNKVCYYKPSLPQQTPCVNIKVKTSLSILDYHKQGFTVKLLRQANAHNLCGLG